jgi:hypothetical protein
MIVVPQPFLRVTTVVAVTGVVVNVRVAVKLVRRVFQ